MARVNVGVNPKFLSDQHLVAESVEITMITGGLKKTNFKITNIPERFPLGKGHINFFKNKLKYLFKRLFEVNKEMQKRGFNPGTKIVLNEYPKHLHNDWTPTKEDTQIIRDRIADRLVTRSNGKTAIGLHRYHKKTLNEETFILIKKLKQHELFYV